MKKILAIILSLCTLLLFAGCAERVDNTLANNEYPDNSYNSYNSSYDNSYNSSYDNSYNSSYDNSYNSSYDNTQSNTETHKHNWRAATCSEPKTCTTCGETSGSRLDCNYAPATCTTPETCTMCGDTRLRAIGHEYFNDTCANCGAKINIPITVEYTSNMKYHDTFFTIEQYNFIGIDKLNEGRCNISITTRNNTGGFFAYHVVHYDANGRVLKSSTCGGSSNAGQSETEDRYIPKNTVRIVIQTAD